MRDGDGRRRGWLAVVVATIGLILAAGCGGNATSTPASRTATAVTVTFAPGDVGGGAAGTAPTGDTDLPAPTLRAEPTLTGGRLHELLPTHLGGTPLDRVDLAVGVDAALAAAVDVRPEALETAVARDSAGLPVARAYRALGARPGALRDALLARLLPPGASAGSGVSLGDHAVLRVDAPGSPTYLYETGEAVVVFGGPAVSESGAEELAKQLP